MRSRKLKDWGLELSSSNIHDDVRILLHASRAGEGIHPCAAENLWREICFDNRVHSMFTDIGVETLEDFTAFMDDEQHLFAIGLVGSKVASLVWLSDPVNKSADIHFVTFKWAYGGVNKLTCAKTLITLLNIPSSDGGYMFDCLVGKTPLNNKLSCRFVRELGLTEVGVIPLGCYDYRKRESTDALVVCCTRGTLAEVSKWIQK